MLNNNDRKNNRLGWGNFGNIAVIVLFFAAVSGWFMTAGSVREKVNSLEDQIVLLRDRIKAVERWQRDWPSEGELMMDRTQNTNIKEILRRVEKLERDCN